MSVPGIAPPVTDGGALLIDGGLLNNLPADVMRRSVPDGKVIAVDLNPRRGPRSGFEYGVELSGWRVLWSRIAPFRRKLDVPSVFEILDRANALSSIQHVADLRRSAINLYIHPVTDDIDFFDLKRVREIAEIGYGAARNALEGWTDLSAVRATSA
jgi:predicted acylesterase/phospholipase RssA